MIAALVTKPPVVLVQRRSVDALQELAKPSSARTTDSVVSSKPPKSYRMGLWKPSYQTKQGTKQAQVIL